MTRSERAVDLFRQQLNCSQAVFAAYRQEEVLDEATALRLATVFGAGGAGTGSGRCGAVSGALLAISLKHGRKDVASAEARTRTYELARRFTAEFEARNGSCTCQEILGINIGTAEGYEQARGLGLFETRCAEAVRSAAEILDRLL
ncbi:MAG TPA: C-GCAxxG-C-C family protein [Anaeromyxobacteraceae bacterium]|nr:C-GCAxxG-C-C family protein [Anaeromyxobacteraceae bacterium]